MAYAFGRTDPETVCKANAFLKLFLMAPRLLLSSRCGVAQRARMLLTGTQEAFEFLLEETRVKPQPRDNRPPLPRTAGNQNQRQGIETSAELRSIQGHELTREYSAFEHHSCTYPSDSGPSSRGSSRALHSYIGSHQDPNRGQRETVPGERSGESDQGPQDTCCARRDGPATQSHQSPL